MAAYKTKKTKIERVHNCGGSNLKKCCACPKSNRFLTGKTRNSLCKTYFEGEVAFPFGWFIELKGSWFPAWKVVRWNMRAIGSANHEASKRWFCRRQIDGEVIRVDKQWENGLILVGKCFFSRMESAFQDWKRGFYVKFGAIFALKKIFNLNIP